MVKSSTPGCTGGYSYWALSEPFVKGYFNNFNNFNMFITGNIERSILHLDLDTFFVSVERLKNSRLTGKPVIIGGMSDRGVVSSCSYEARKFGVSSAMPMKLARNMCPDAIIIRGDMELYSSYSNIVTDIIAERSPLYEKASIDRKSVV